MGPTLLGVLALLLWSSTIAFSRSLTEQVGTLTAAAAVYLLGGALGSAPLLVDRRRRDALAELPRAYLGACGALFALYAACLYGAVGLARGRAQVVEVGLLNYLWPSLTLVFSVPLLGRRASWSLVPGLALGAGGVALAMTAGGELAVGDFADRLRTSALPYGLALAAAVAWGLYNNLARRLAPGERAGSAVPLFVLAAGLLLLGLRLLVDERSTWTPRALAELAYMALGPTLLAYGLWDRAMRAGRLVLLASLSYLTPVLSTFLSGCYLGVPLGPRLWLGCALVVSGAALCSRSLEDPPAAQDPVGTQERSS